MKSDDIDKIKRFCCDLMRNQAKCDAVVSAALGQLAEYEARGFIEERIIKAKGWNKILFLFHQFMMTKQIEKIVKQAHLQKS